MESLGTNSVKLKKLNRNIILASLQGSESLSVAETSRRTGLSIATCALALSEMAECGEALVLEERKSEGGRPARRFAFNPDHMLVAALFLTARHEKETLSYFVANAHGEVVGSGIKKNSKISIGEIEDTISQLSAQHPKLRSVAISVPGVVKNGTVDICDISSLVGIQLEERIRAASGLEVVADNDINFA